MSYDHWKTTDPGAEFLGPDPDEEPTTIMSKSFKSFKDIGGRLVPVTVNFEYPPIPIRSCDWRAWYTDDQSDNPNCGWGATPDDAIQDLVDSYEDPEQPITFEYEYECDLIAERGQMYAYEYLYFQEARK